MNTSGVSEPLNASSFFQTFIGDVTAKSLMPSIVYGIGEDWELMLTAQAAFGSLGNTFKSMGSGVYLRLMYSF